MTEAGNVNAEHYFELPWHQPVFTCLCRRAWLRLLQDPERALDQYGHVLHVSSDGVFRCCTRAWKWVPSPEPGKEHLDNAG